MDDGNKKENAKKTIGLISKKNRLAHPARAFCILVHFFDVLPHGADTLSWWGNLCASATPESYTDGGPASRRCYHVGKVFGIDARRNSAPGLPGWACG